MTWIDNDPMVLYPTVSAILEVEEGGDPTESGWVQCDELGCEEFWGVHGSGDKDFYLRTQGWSAVPTPDGVMEHKCLAHA